MKWNGKPVGQCQVCKHHWTLEWMDGDTCIECLEIAVNGISMSEEITFQQMMEDNNVNSWIPPDTF